MMHQNKYITLQSGYVSRPQSDFYRYVAPETSFKQQLLGQSMMGLIPEGYYSKSITALVDEYEKDRQILNNFKFRERVLVAAIALFADTTVPEWLKAQRDTDYFSDLHKTFAVETLNFIVGIPRTIDCVQWMSLLDAGKSNMKTYFDYTEYFNHAHKPMPIPSSTLDLIRLWVSRDQGYEDLLLSLWCFFGKRTIQHDVHTPNKNSFDGVAFGMVFGGNG